MNFNKFLGVILITFTVLLCNINLCLGDIRQVNPIGLTDIDPVTNPAMDNWLTEEIAKQVNKDDIAQLTQDDFNKVSSIYKNREGIINIPKEIGNLYNLVSLDLNSNNIEIIPYEIGNLSQLKSLDIGHNKIYELPSSFYNLTNLNYLTLSYNNLKSLSNEIGNLTNLKSIGLNNNNLNFIPSTISNLKNLELLNLYNNKLISIPPEIGILNKLSYLRLEKNCLVSIPKELLNLNHTSISFGSQKIILPEIINTSGKIIIDNPIKCFNEIISPTLWTISNSGLYDAEYNTISWDIKSTIQEVSFKFDKTFYIPDFYSNELFFTGTVTIPIISDEDAIALNAEIQKAKDLLESDDVTSDKLIESILGLSNAITTYEKSHNKK